ncbi:MAG TPA: CPBP family intramembrane glutamic endopeptidase [Candidatus Saccharimonadales bacterium]|nr:CPBP family intramembrane glutamic endopeptidase [Candidatus Saccharimonadales bacterium]
MSNDSSSDHTSPAQAKPAVAAEPAAATGKAPYKKWPWGPGAGIIVSLGSFLIGQLLVGGVIAVVLAIAGWSGGRIEDWMNTIPGMFALVVCSETLALGILAWFIKRRKGNWRMLGFARGLRAKDLGLGFLWLVIYFTLLFAVASIARAFLHVDLDQKQELGFDHLKGNAEYIMAFVSLVILPPFVEETIFRGFLFTGLRKKLHFVYAALITSALFAVPHLLESSSGILWIAGIDTFLMSLVLCHLREKTGALWAGIMIHFLKNGTAFLALYFS